MKKSMIKHLDRAAFPAIKETPFGAAWPVDIAAGRLKHNVPENADTTVAQWIVFAPWSHPFWPYCLCSVIHLRMTPPLDPARIYVTGATHEIVIASMDPTHEPDPLWPRVMRPLNYCGQFIVQARRNPVDLDRAAAARLEATVDEILRGELNPDSDGLAGWVERFGGEMLK